MNMKIAKAQPFSGAPVIQMPSVYGVPCGKPILYHIPVTGERPLKVSAEGLDSGLTLENGVISGTVQESCEFTVTLKAGNQQGVCEKQVLFRVGEDIMLLTPLMGFTTWNAFGSSVSQKDVETTAALITETGLREYGYRYVNLDSGWQKEYGGVFDAIQPNSKFPDIAAMYDRIHALGLQGGIYATPMLTAWGCPEAFASIPGCTRGEPDPLCTNTMGGIGVVHCEKNNVRQWEKWGVDYLKYDWAPCDPPTADFMKKELLVSNRAFAFCITTSASESYGHYWSKNCTSWRNNADSIDEWPRLAAYMASVDRWKKYVRPGHFYDLDMLETGAMEWNSGTNRLTDEEKLFAYTLRAFFISPIQLSCRIDQMTEFEFNMVCNEEIIALNQDSLCDYPTLVHNDKEKNAKLYTRTLEKGDRALAVFNLGEEQLDDQLLFEKEMHVRNLWSHEDMGNLSVLHFTAQPHGVQVFRISPVK